jgi:Putative addiction module component
MELATLPAGTMTLEELEQQLLQLPLEARTRLAEVLDESVRREVEAAWDEEVERRHQAFLRGELEAFPAKEALAELRAKMLG